MRIVIGTILPVNIHIHIPITTLPQVGLQYQRRSTLVAKPFRPKRQIKKLCPNCHQPILAGDAAVRKYFKGKVYWHYHTYHIDCWYTTEKKLLADKMERMEIFFQENPYRPKQMVSLRSSSIGYQQVRRLKALRRYHSKVGNEERVKELTNTINKLEGRI